jgi:hypothetical protein
MICSGRRYAMRTSGPTWATLLRAACIHAAMAKRLEPFDAVAFGPGPRWTRRHHWTAQIVLVLGCATIAAPNHGAMRSDIRRNMTNRLGFAAICVS